LVIGAAGQARLRLRALVSLLSLSRCHPSTSMPLGAGPLPRPCRVEHAKDVRGGVEPAVDRHRERARSAALSCRSVVSTGPPGLPRPPGLAPSACLLLSALRLVSPPGTALAVNPLPGLPPPGSLSPGYPAPLASSSRSSPASRAAGGPFAGRLAVLPRRACSRTMSRRPRSAGEAAVPLSLPPQEYSIPHGGSAMERRVAPLMLAASIRRLRPTEPSSRLLPSSVRRSIYATPAARVRLGDGGERHVDCSDDILG
jgi:hypothetical protein